MTNLSREIPSERYHHIEESVYQYIFSLIHRKTPRDQIVGMETINALLTVPSTESETRLIRFYNIVSMSLKNNTNVDVLSAAATTMGHIARSSVTSSADLVETEISRALEWLATDQQARLMAACLVLKELAINAPISFYVRASSFLDNIIPVILHEKQEIRDVAFEALRECLAIVATRNPRVHTTSYNKMFMDVS